MQLTGTIQHDLYVEFRYTGDVDFASVIDAFAGVLKHCRAQRCRGALLDFSGTTSTLTALERMDIARMLPNDLAHGIVLAVVVHQAQHLEERPGQLAAQNRGIRAREFTSIDAAATWLSAVLRDTPA
jgi:hypothetical protein